MSIARHHIRVTAPDGSGAVEDTLAAWGFEACRVKRQAGGEDEMHLAHAASLTGSALIEGGSTVELFDPLGVRRFYGYALRPRRTVSGAPHRHVVRVVGPHFWLARVTAVEPWTYATDTADPESPTATSDISSVVLHRLDGGTGARVKLSASIAGILAGAKALGCPVSWNLDHFPEVYLPEQSRRIATPWQLLRDAMAFVPQVTLGWDYTGEAGTDPILRFSTSVGGEIQSHWPQKELHLDLLSNQSVSIVPRDDLLVKEVRVHYVSHHVIENEGARKVVLRGITTKTSAAVDGEDGFDAFGSADITFELRGGTWNNGSLTEVPELVPPDSTAAIGPRNLAESLHEAFVHLWHEISGVVVLKSTAWSWQIGQRALPVGFGDDLNSARLAVVGIENDVAGGSVSLQCGPPGRLIHGTIYDIVKAAREAVPSEEQPGEHEVPDNSRDEHGGSEEHGVREELYYSHGGVLFKGDFDVLNEEEA